MTSDKLNLGCDRGEATTYAGNLQGVVKPNDQLAQQPIADQNVSKKKQNGPFRASL
jgi:hypothetical protein